MPSKTIKTKTSKRKPAKKKEVKFSVKSITHCPLCMGLLIGITLKWCDNCQFGASLDENHAWIWDKNHIIASDYSFEKNVFNLYKSTSPIPIRETPADFISWEDLRSKLDDVDLLFF